MTVIRGIRVKFRKLREQQGTFFVRVWIKCFDNFVFPIWVCPWTFFFIKFCYCACKQEVENRAAFAIAHSLSLSVQDRAILLPLRLEFSSPPGNSGCKMKSRSRKPRLIHGHRSFIQCQDVFPPLKSGHYQSGKAKIRKASRTPPWDKANTICEAGLRIETLGSVAESVRKILR